MDNKFVDEMNFNGVVRYNNPVIITLSGLPGSGKTAVARELSKRLSIYLLSNDYVRNYYYQLTSDCSEEKRQEIEKIVAETNDSRIIKLLDSRISFVYDMDFNCEEKFKEFMEKFDISNYHLIKIKVNSTDEHNINEVKQIKMDYNYIFEGVLGDNVEYLSSFPTNVYYEIKERKPQELPDNYFDYAINSIDKKQFNIALDTIVEKIKGEIK